MQVLGAIRNGVSTRRKARGNNEWLDGGTYLPPARIIKILLVSGNAATQNIMDTASAHGHTFELLAKPVPPKDLLLKVASMLSDNESQQSRTARARFAS